MHASLHRQLTGESGLLRAVILLLLFFIIARRERINILKIFPQSLLPLFLHHLVSVTSNYAVSREGEVKRTNKSGGNLRSQHYFPEVLLLIPLRQNSLSPLCFVYYCFMKE